MIRLFSEDSPDGKVDVDNGLKLEVAIDKYDAAMDTLYANVYERGKLVASAVQPGDAIRNCVSSALPSVGVDDR